VIHDAQAIPEPGQAFTFHGFRFEILRKSKNKITAIRIKPIAVNAAPAVRGTATAGTATINATRKRHEQQQAAQTPPKPKPKTSDGDSLEGG
jgi:hypothetical protein